MNVALASDHAGWERKEQARALVAALGHSAQDFGCSDAESCDYPDSAVPAVRAIGAGSCERAILICGTGIGMSILANKIRGIRAALCYNTSTAKVSRSHNNSNVLCLGARELSGEAIEEIIRTWLDTPFSGGRHQRRLNKVMAIEEER